MGDRSSGRQAVEPKPGRAKLWLELGRALAKAGDVAEASDVLAQCAANHPQNREARFLPGLVLGLDAQYARAVDEFAEAHRQLVNAGKTDARADSDGSVLYAEASSLEAGGNTRAAIAALQRILECQPGFLLARDRLRAHYMANGGYARALSLYHVKMASVWLWNQIVGEYGRWSKFF